MKPTLRNMGDVLKEATADQRKKSALGHSVIMPYLSGPKVHSLPISITLLHLFIVQENNWDSYVSLPEFLVS